MLVLLVFITVFVSDTKEDIKCWSCSPSRFACMHGLWILNCICTFFEVFLNVLCIVLMHT